MPTELDRAGSHLSLKRRPPGRRLGMSLIELMIGLALAATLLTALATAVQAMTTSVRANQAQLQARRTSQTVMDYLVTQLRRADQCQVISVQGNADQATVQATEIAAIFGGGSARTDAAPTDYLELHIKTDLGNGQSGLMISMNTRGLKWNGTSYAGAWYTVPNVTWAQMQCDWVDRTQSINARNITIQTKVQAADRGMTAEVPMTSSVTIRRAGL